ncbi:Rv3235 family protein [Amycolatopsis suaedae]|uniref:Uncharacterized protein n=1 Tax=Amycolatopsis suaedae TaxID=2510978 RepID=A0A4Q7J051_9PSEU|nr:Rv3235 family protein [Amycolatopsis suaedae]RZQ60710.1 hypothetical protein EWH70_26715 [Amycolatopsis suaedae]
MSEIHFEPLPVTEPDGSRHPAPHRGRQLALDLRLDTEPAGPRWPAPVGAATLRHLRGLVTTVLEVHSGRRPPGQARVITDTRLHRRLATLPDGRHLGYRLSTLHAQYVGDGVVEASGTVRTGHLTLALTARLHAATDGWTCVRFEVIDNVPAQEQSRTGTAS